MANKLLIGSGNPGKIERWKNYLDGIELITPKDLDLNLEINEGMTSLKENSILKAGIYAKESNYPSLSEDTGLFIEELGGRPGVAARRWGGELPDNVSDEDFKEFVKNKISHLENPNAYFKSVISIAYPNGRTESITQKIEGVLDKSRLEDDSFTKGFPLSAVFVFNSTGKTWVEMNLEEKRFIDQDVIEQVKKIVCG